MNHFTVKTFKFYHFSDETSKSSWTVLAQCHLQIKYIPWNGSDGVSINVIRIGAVSLYVFVTRITGAKSRDENSQKYAK